MLDFIYEQINSCTSPEEIYICIINLGKQAQKLDEIHKTNQNQVSGCQSQVWLISKEQDDRIYFYGDSDSLLVRGLVFITTNFFSGKIYSEIQNTEPIFVSELRLEDYLTAGRVNGLHQVIKKIRSI